LVLRVALSTHGPLRQAPRTVNGNRMQSALPQRPLKLRLVCLQLACVLWDVHGRSLNRHANGTGVWQCPIRWVGSRLGSLTPGAYYDRLCRVNLRAYVPCLITRRVRDATRG
jgi:hypothetical protein